ncbi:MAG: hypothetical protein M9949_14445 [Candidatus Kapabacteria bacterium]|nr:hypothetical protein [Candidatus Kapabacteria bacterium]
MRVSELKEILENLDDDMEVRVASQPNYPFEYAIDGAVSGAELELDGCDNILYLVEGEQIGYFTKKAWEMI